MSVVDTEGNSLHFDCGGNLKDYQEWSLPAQLEAAMLMSLDQDPISRLEAMQLRGVSNRINLY